MSTLRECIQAYKAGLATRAPGRPVKVIRAVALGVARWRAIERDMAGVRPGQRTYRRGSRAERCRLLAETGERLGLERAGRRGLDGGRAVIHANDCPIGPGCVACQRIEAEQAPVIQSSAAHLGRCWREGASIREVAVWLRYEVPGEWWGAPEGELQRVACWLIRLRRQVELGRWKQ